MASLTIQNLINKNFQVAKPGNVSSIRAQAEFLINNWKGLGQTSPVNWGKDALRHLQQYENLSEEDRNKKVIDRDGIGESRYSQYKKLKDERVDVIQAVRKEYDRAGKTGYGRDPRVLAAQAELDAFVEQHGVTQGEKKLAEAYRWVTGEAQSHKRSRSIDKAKSAISDLKKKIANEASNIANVLDIPADMDAATRAKLEARAAEIQEELNPLIEQAEAFGLNTSKLQNLVRTASGFIPQSELDGQSLRPDPGAEFQDFIDFAKSRGVQQDPRTGELLNVPPTLFEEFRNQTPQGTSTSISIALAGGPDGGPPAGATLIRDPAELANYTEDQIWRDPNSNDIYALGTASTPGGQKTFYRVGGDIFEAETGRHIGPSEWERDWSGQATEVAAPPSPGDPSPDVSPPTSTDTTSSSPTPTITSDILPDEIDLTGYTAEQVATLESIYLTAQGDERIIAAQQLTDDEIAQFLTDAQAELNPYFEQQFRRAQEEFLRGIENKAIVREIELRREQRQAEIEQERLAESSAEAGLATSGIRQKAERRLTDELADIALSSRTKFDFDIETLGREAEDLLGSRNLPDNLLFEADGEVRGSLERQQTTSEQERAAELEQEERARRVGLLESASGVTTLP